MPEVIFDVSGPLHLLSCFDWRNTFHRRSLAASLVQGVYSLERDRQRQRRRIEHGHDAQAWWKRFHFQLICVLEDDRDSSYFGAIYELRCADPCFYQSSTHRPSYVIAFRGTLRTCPTLCEDIKQNLKSALAKLEESSRFKTAFQAVWNTVATAGPANVWLAGHSLGASIAMLAGKKLAMLGFHLETYLFNPPFISVPLEQMIKNQTLKHGVRIASSLLKAGIASAMNINEDMSSVLSEWRPHVFVNPKDIVCGEYIGYFEHREKMEEIGVGEYGRIGTIYSFRCLVSSAFGRKMEPLHIVPTAYMTVNLSPSEGFKQAHGLVQWWQPHNQWQSKLYKFETP